MAYNYEWPYTDPTKFNADWLLRKMKELDEEWKKFKPEMLQAFEDFKKEVTENQNAFQAQIEAAFEAYKKEINGEVGALQEAMEKILTDFAAFKDEINEKTAGYDEKISDLSDKVDDQENVINAFKADINSQIQTQNEAIAALETSQSQQDTKISALETSQSQQDTKITALETSQTQQDTKITALETSQTQQDTKITALETSQSQQDTKITALETSQSQQDTKITALETSQTVQDSSISSLDSRVTSLESGGGGGGGTGVIVDVTTILGWPPSGGEISTAFNSYTAAHPDHIMYFPAGTYTVQGGLQVTRYTFCDKNVFFNMQEASAFIGYPNATGEFYWQGGTFQWETGSGQSLFYGHNIHIADVTGGGFLSTICYLYGASAIFVAENCSFSFTGTASTLVTALEVTGAIPFISLNTCKIGAVTAIINGTANSRANSMFSHCHFAGSDWTNNMLRNAFRSSFIDCSIQIAGTVNFTGDVSFIGCNIIWTATLPGSGNEPTLSFIGCKFASGSDNPSTMLSRTNSSSNVFGSTIIK